MKDIKTKLKIINTNNKQNINIVNTEISNIILVMNNISYNLIEKINSTFYKQLLDLQKKINLKIETKKKHKNNKMFYYC